MLIASVNPSWDLRSGGGDPHATTTVYGVLTMGRRGGGGRGGTQATCGKQPRLAPWCRNHPALSCYSCTPDSCGFPRRKQPRMATYPARAFALAPGFPAATQQGWELGGFSEENSRRMIGRRSQAAFPRLCRSQAASFQGPRSYLDPGTCAHTSCRVRASSCRGGAPACAPSADRLPRVPPARSNSKDPGFAKPRGVDCSGTVLYQQTV
jgi:hypothetical protein